MTSWRSWLAASLALVGCEETASDPEPPEVPPPVRRDDPCPLHTTDPAYVVDLAGNEDIIMALLSDGRALCWGKDAGSCGFDFPFPFDGGEPFMLTASDCLTAIYPGAHSMSAARLWDDSLVLWGPETDYEAGDGPGRGPGFGKQQPLVLPERIESVNAGSASMLAVAESGSLYYWGFLPDSPWDVPGLYPAPGLVKEVALGLAACLLLDSGDVSCFGLNQAGILGLPPPPPNTFEWVFEPQEIAMPGPALQIGVGDRTACALIGTEVWCWGGNDGGAFGVPFEALPYTATPFRIEGLPSAKSLEVASPDPCVIDFDDRVTCWGDGVAWGTAPDGDPSPEPWYPEFQVKDLALASQTVCALLLDGQIYCSGLVDGLGSQTGAPSGFVDIEGRVARTQAARACVATGGLLGPYCEYRDPSP